MGFFNALRNVLWKQYQGTYGGIFILSGLNFNAATQIQENKMLRFLLCLFGLHGSTEIDYTVDDEEIKVCRDCMKEIKWLNSI